MDDTLGVGTSLKGNEQAHHCPFCHHHKKKLQINLESQQWHCWVCDSKGRKIQTLLRRLHVDNKKIKKIYEIYGDDYATDDGTGVRDYIHIVDLAAAHSKAIDYLANTNGLKIFNLGTGKGISVLDLINTFEKVTGSSLPKVAP